MESMQQVSKQLIKGLPRRIALMLLDCGLIVLCYWLAVMLRFDSGDAYRRVEILRAMAPMLLYVLPIYMIVFWFGGLYEICLLYTSMPTTSVPFSTREIGPCFISPAANASEWM